MKPAPIIINLNKMIKEYADEMGYNYIDYHSTLTTANGALNPQYTNDRCHPTRDGYVVMMTIAQNVLLPMLNAEN